MELPRVDLGVSRKQFLAIKEPGVRHSIVSRDDLEVLLLHFFKVDGYTIKSLPTVT